VGVEVFNEVMLFMNERERACIYADVLFFSCLRYDMLHCVTSGNFCMVWEGVFFIRHYYIQLYMCFFKGNLFIYILYQANKHFTHM